jgi:hypothetical protein
VKVAGKVAIQEVRGDAPKGIGEVVVTCPIRIVREFVVVAMHLQGGGYPRWA